jgi:hypothetical protein
MKRVFWLRNEFLMELMTKEGFWMNKRVVLQAQGSEGKGIG